MGFRQNYIKSTRLKLTYDIHVHHIDRDRKNNELDNLVHLPRLTHIRFHKLMDLVNQIDYNLKVYDLTIDDMIKSKHIYTSMVMFVPMDNWAKKLLSIEKQIKKKILKRNLLLKIEIDNELITQRQRKIIEACLKY